MLLDVEISESEYPNWEKEKGGMTWCRPGGDTEMFLDGISVKSCISQFDIHNIIQHDEQMFWSASLAASGPPVMEEEGGEQKATFSCFYVPVYHLVLTNHHVPIYQPVPQQLSIYHHFLTCHHTAKGMGSKDGLSGLLGHSVCLVWQAAGGTGWDAVERWEEPPSDGKLHTFPAVVHEQQLCLQTETYYLICFPRAAATSSTKSPSKLPGIDPWRRFWKIKN